MPTHIAMLKAGKDWRSSARIIVYASTATGVGSTQEAADADLRLFIAMLREGHMRAGEPIPPEYDEPLEVAFGEFDDKGNFIRSKPL